MLREWIDPQFHQLEPCGAEERAGWMQSRLHRLFSFFSCSGKAEAFFLRTTIRGKPGVKRDWR
jgi:hypothetical protein